MRRKESKDRYGGSVYTMYDKNNKHNLSPGDLDVEHVIQCGQEGGGRVFYAQI